LVMCKDLWRFPLEWENGNKYGKNNQRREVEMGKTDSGKAGEVGECRESMINWLCYIFFCWLDERV